MAGLAHSPCRRAVSRLTSRLEPIVTFFEMAVQRARDRPCPAPAPNPGPGCNPERPPATLAGAVRAADQPLERFSLANFSRARASACSMW